jgi:hypothetical protein
MIRMYDSITVGEIPANAQAVAGYTGGKWPTANELAKRFPNAKRLTIAVRAADDGECLDIETGDASPSDAPAWFHRQIARGVKRPCFYTSLSNVNTLLHALTTAGIQRSRYRVWSAHYTGTAHLCGPQEGIATHADATQYWDKALGRNLDVSLCEDSFFGAPSPPSSYVPADEARWEREFDGLKGRNGPWAKLRRRVLTRTMLHRQREIVALAYKTGWDTLNRHARYRLLFSRTNKR